VVVAGVGVSDTSEHVRELEQTEVLENVLVESSWHPNNISGDVSGTVFWCASPGTAQILSSNYEVRSPEYLCGLAVYNRVWKYLHDARGDIEQALRDTGPPGEEDLYARCFLRDIVCLMSAMACKAITLSAWLEETSGTNRMIVGSQVLSDVQIASPILSDADDVFAALAFASKLDVPQLATQSANASLLRKKFDYVPAFDKVFNIVNRPAGSLFWKLSQRFGVRATLSKPKGVMCYLSHNDFIEEATIGMHRQGWKVIRTPTPSSYPSRENAVPDFPVLADAISSLWRAAVADIVLPRVADCALRIVTTRSREALAFFDSEVEFAEAFADRVKALRQDGQPIVAISNGLYAPRGRIIGRALKERKVPLICFDHGVGLGVTDRTAATVGDFVCDCDDFLCHNEDNRKRLGGASEDKHQRFDVIGAPAVMRRARFPFLQGLAARAHLGVGMRQPMLLYVCNLLANNRIQGWGQIPDSYYDQFRSQVIDTLPSFCGTSIVKPYPTFRHTDPDPVLIRSLPNRVRVAPFGEFRHLRWAADVLVLDISSSTLGWAMAPGCPLVYIDNPSNPMSSEAREAIRDAVFFVDAINDPDWEARLKELLEQPLGTLRATWKQKEKARRVFNETFQLGPPGSAVPRVVSHFWRYMHG